MDRQELARRRVQSEKKRILEALCRSMDLCFSPYKKAGICLAVSGGADSRALLELVARWPLRHEGRFSVICVDHGLRPESGREAAYVIARAHVLGFNAELRKIYPLMAADEASLRTARYKILWEAARASGAAALALAHHADDVVEGQVMSWLGSAGLGHGAVRAVVHVKGEGCLLRPFIQLRSEHLALALSALDCNDFFTDPTNYANTGRALVRNEVLPYLRTINPRIEQRFISLGRRLQQDKAFLDDLAAKYPLIVDRQRIILDYIKIPDGIFERVLLRAIRCLDPEADLRMSHKLLAGISYCIDPVSRSFTVKHGKERSFEFPGVSVLINRKEIVLTRNYDAGN